MTHFLKRASLIGGFLLLLNAALGPAADAAPPGPAPPGGHLNITAVVVDTGPPGLLTISGENFDLGGPLDGQGRPRRVRRNPRDRQRLGDRDRRRPARRYPTPARAPRGSSMCSPARASSTVRLLATAITFLGAGILAADQPVRERRNQREHPQYSKPELVATAPNQTWSWDITKLLGPTKWTSTSSYNWRCRARWARRHPPSGVRRQPLLRGQFKTLKYHPGFPGRFHVTAAIAFCRDGIAMLTPDDASNRTQSVLEQRGRTSSRLANRDRQDQPTPGRPGSAAVVGHRGPQGENFTRTAGSSSTCPAVSRG